ncbi:MAG: hypothetical protein ABIT20_06120 [Gemmatimonadaceae bacterium]
MYSTCIFCTRSLGHNEALEHFPVGRRLAFDAAKGRLWVICAYCRSWNLTPLEERWEAVEEAERLFRSTPLRVSTDHIGLARVADGTDLVRIGAPQRPELAAWRYGERFTRRRRRYLLGMGAIAIAGGAIVAGELAIGIGVGIALSLANSAFRYARREIVSSVARLRDERGQLIEVTRENLNGTTISIGRDGGLALMVEHGERRRTRFEGTHARRAASVIFPAVNLTGGTKEDVQTAVKRLVHAGSAEEFLTRLARRSARLPGRTAQSDDARAEVRLIGEEETGLLALPTSLGLAIEMALHEEQERVAFEGELADLEAAWREAEEIGAIADNMFLPSGIEKALARLRR